MARFFIMIKFIGPNGNGIISEYTYDRADVKMAEKKAMAQFGKDCKKMYGETWESDIEIKEVWTEKMKDGLHNQRHWKNYFK